MSKLKELREQRGQAVHDARAILDKAESEKRSLTAEETAQVDSLIGKQEELRSGIEREEKLAEAERSAAAEALRNRDNRKAASGSADDKTDEYRNMFAKFMAYGERGMTGDEIRALQSDTATAGGFLVMPQQMVQGLLKAVDDATLVRGLATKFQVPTAASLGVPSLTADPGDADWTAEILTGSEDSTMAFGKRELNPHPLAKRIKLSNKLLRQVPGIEALVNARLAYKFAVSQEKAHMTGNGVNQPLGLFTASANGITTARDVSTGNTTTAFTVDGLIEAKYACKAQYQRTGQWIFHRDAVKMLAKLKDGEGEYIWRPSVIESEPDMLLGRPVNMSEFAPNTFTTGLYVGIFGDFSNYWIADALNMQMQRLTELYAETNQTGFIGRLESDGMPTLAEAFSRVKLA